MATPAVATRPPLPPFTRESATQKVRLAEDGWNTRDPGKVALAYAVDSRWRNRSEFVNGREAIIDFLSRKWAKELDYRLIKELWVFTGNRIAVRFAYEWHDDSGHWYRSYGNENWEFNDDGLMARIWASDPSFDSVARHRRLRQLLGEKSICQIREWQALQAHNETRFTLTSQTKGCSDRSFPKTSNGSRFRHFHLQSALPSLSVNPRSPVHT